MTHSKRISEIEVCKTNTEACASHKIDAPLAKEAYEIGCSKRDGRSCYYLGQWYETKAEDSAQAVKAYERSCLNNNKAGCKAEKVLRTKLCEVEDQKSFCI